MNPDDTSDTTKRITSITSTTTQAQKKSIPSFRLNYE